MISKEALDALKTIPKGYDGLGEIDVFQSGDKIVFIFIAFSYFEITTLEIAFLIPDNHKQAHHFHLFQLSNFHPNALYICLTLFDWFLHRKLLTLLRLLFS